MMDTNIQISKLNTNTRVNTRLSYIKDTCKETCKTVLTPALGNITSYSANQQNQAFQKKEITPAQLKKLKYDYKKAKVELKRKIGIKVPRVCTCGIRPISKDITEISMVQGEKGGIYYTGMQRCGSVWFCPDCMYKLMKARADELYNQLQAYKVKGKTILFVTFTLQHNKGDRLQHLHGTLLKAFGFANSHRTWIEAKKQVPVEYLRTLEVLFGLHGWHPHLHTLFVGDEKIISAMEIFVNLYKQYLQEHGLLVNDHTVIVDKWNGTLDDMTDYMFKGKLEKELTGGNLTKSGKGKTFFELVEDWNEPVINEYIEVMKGKRQYHSSRKFFKDVRVQTDQEVLRDDKVNKVILTIPVAIYHDIVRKGIALHLLNEYEYGGVERMTRILELYDCDAGGIEYLI